MTEFCIRRPVFTIVLSLLIVLVGVVALLRLPVREYPNIDEPVVTVDVRYRGAGAEIIESQVTQVLEESLSGIDGLDTLTSVSRPEQSQITLKFKLNRNGDSAANDVRDRVSRVRQKLPTTIDEPVISKVEADAQPIIYLAFSSSNHTSLEITDFADRHVKDQLKTIDGVSDVLILGERRYAMRLWIDRDRLAAYAMTTGDVESALLAQNIEIPAGRIESKMREMTVLAETDLKTPAEFDNIILKNTGGYFVRFRDVGHAELGAAADRTIVRFNGKNAVALGIVKQAQANPLTISKSIYRLFPHIRAGLPDGMAMDVGYDTSVFIAKSIDAVYKTIFEAIALVIFVIFLFLRNVRAVLIPLVTIPVSLIGTAALMLAFGFSLNTLTLLAVVLAIGLVVDDAIVMLENIYRGIEKGMKPLDAAILGSRQILFAIIAMTLTLVSVYVPIGFMEGRVGRLFTEFAWTLAGAVLISGFVALTLSPMMCAYLLSKPDSGAVSKRGFGALFERGFSALESGYDRLLADSFNARTLWIIVALAFGGASALLIHWIPSELAPIEDRGTVVSVGIGPEGSTLAATDQTSRQVETFFDGIPEQNCYFLVAGTPVVSQYIAFLGLKPWDARNRPQKAIAGELMGKLMGLTGMLAFAVNPASLGQSPVARPVMFVLKSSLPYAELAVISDAVLGRAYASKSLMLPDSDLKLNKPQLSIIVDRNKSSDIGIPVSTIGRTLETFLGSRQITTFKRDGKQYDVIVQVANDARRLPTDISDIFVRAPGGTMIQLANLVSITETVSPKELNRFGQSPAATITASLKPGFSLGDALSELQAITQDVAGDKVQIDYQGESREFKESGAEMIVTFALALLFIYLVLCAQFESFKTPFIIMLTVPLSMTGALLVLFLGDGTLNVYSQIGLVTLVGLITKNGILIVSFADELMAAGKTKWDAVRESASIRLRPILMTTGAMIFGSLPLALASGPGAESRRAIGLVVVGGLSFGTLLTLFVIPVVYTLLVGKSEKKSTLGG